MGVNQFTYKISTVLSNEVIVAEPITLAECKDYMGIGFANHDTKLNMLITACRIEAEKFLNVTLIQSRTVSVAWQSLYDSELLPFSPVSNVSLITATDLEDVVIDSVKFEEVGGFTYIKGDYPLGIKLSYGTVSLSYKADLKQKLIRAVAMCFEHAQSPRESVVKEFKNHLIN